MRTQNIECQLAQSQLNRYLAGEPFSETAVRQLEEHVNECPACTLLIAQRKQALLAESKSQPATHAAAHVPGDDGEDSHEESGMPRFLVNAIRSKKAPKAPDSDQPTSETKPAKPTAKRTAPAKPTTNAAVIHDEREPAATKGAYLKPLIYSIALGAVLIGMSSIMKDPTRLFGQRAANELPTGGASSSSTSDSGGSKAASRPSNTDLNTGKSTIAKAPVVSSTVQKPMETSIQPDTRDPMARPNETKSNSGSNARTDERPVVKASQKPAAQPKRAASTSVRKTAPRRTAATRTAAPRRSAATARRTPRRSLAAAKRQVPIRRVIKARKPAPKTPANHVRLSPETPKANPAPKTNSGVVIYDDAGKPVSKP